MKISKLIIATLMMTMWSISSYAQCDHSKMGSSGHNSKSHTVNSHEGHATIPGLKTEIFKVSGVCGMCENSIEKAAKIEGVNMAEWNSKTNILTLAYDPGAVTSDSVLKLIADAGYDNEKYKSDDKIYDALPGCCKYERMVYE